MPRAAATKLPAKNRPASEARKPLRQPKKVVDLTHYAPAYFTWIANKLSSGASQAYLAAFDVGIETWRVLVLLAIDTSISANRVVKVIGMDKASVSRVFKTMQQRGLITIGLDPQDGRMRVATITAEGRELHDKILQIALDRDRALMSVLSPDEREVLLGLLRRLHDNLPAVEASTAQYLALHYPHAARRRRKTPTEE
jgi:DNA-binding MarR family transcriptional regulator